MAALFVEPRGCYSGLDGVDLWDAERDARLYDGPWPVVAHPPCERWGRYWGGGPSAKTPRKLGDDGGCFESALSSVRRWGGVLEHPEASHAWRVFSLPIPQRNGGWQAGIDGGWSCCVEQVAYGHPARKATWLYSYGCELPSLRWGRARGVFQRLDAGFHSTEQRRKSDAKPIQRLNRDQRVGTPPEFRDVLIAMARSASEAAK